MAIRKPKKCQYCGKLYASKLATCPKCNSIPPPPPPPQPTYIKRKAIKKGRVQL